VPGRIITAIQERLTRLERIGYFDPGSKFRPGDRVRITCGPLKDLEAVFDRNLSKDGRVRILLEFLGQLTACEVESDWLAKAGG
jgi:transcription antitermination factor NusG